ALGGRPESVRAHDRTWSLEHGWHPHLHGLLFLRSEALAAPEVEELLWQRWTGLLPPGPRRLGWNGKDSPGALASALRSFKNFCCKSLARASELSGSVQLFTVTQDGCSAAKWQCPSRRGCSCYDCTLQRARRLFGAKLIPKGAPLLDSLRRVSQLLD